MEHLRSLSNTIFQLGLEIDKLHPGEANNVIIYLSPFLYTHLFGGYEKDFGVSVTGPFGQIKLEMK
jgi:hypothetical protein